MTANWFRFVPVQDRRIVRHWRGRRFVLHPDAKARYYCEVMTAIVRKQYETGEFVRYLGVPQP